MLRVKNDIFLLKFILDLLTCQWQLWSQISLFNLTTVSKPSKIRYWTAAYFDYFFIFRATLLLHSRAYEEKKQLGEVEDNCGAQCWDLLLKILDLNKTFWFFFISQFTQFTGSSSWVSRSATITLCCGILRSWRLQCAFRPWWPYLIFVTDPTDISV